MKSPDTYDWKAQRERNAFLALEDGTIFHGHSIGADVDTPGEVVFNTGMTGYQEILSDPSYAGQFVCLTAPEIGNYGVNSDDMEAERFFASGLLVHRVSTPSNWRSREDIRPALKSRNTPALACVDTRALAAHIRDNGAMKSFLCASGRLLEAEAVGKARAWEGIGGRDYVHRVTCRERYAWDATGRLPAGFPHEPASLPPASHHVVAYDFGIKWNILRCLRRAGLAVTVVPADTPADDVLAMKPDGVFLSNGPGDPAAVDYAIGNIRAILGKLPIMGICLGHQLLALALGAKILKLPFGHHGCNHPVKDIGRNRTLVTSQNHNYAVIADSLVGAGVEVTHYSLNDGSVEGLRSLESSAFSVQFHPEAAPGPHDAGDIFTEFAQLIKQAATR